MLLSEVISNSSSSELSHSNGARLGSIDNMSPSDIVIAKRCSATEKYLFCIFCLDVFEPIRL